MTLLCKSDRTMGKNKEDEDGIASLTENILEEVIRRQPLPDLRDVAEEFGLSLIVLFGSTTRGRRKPDSDLDIGVLFVSGHPEITLQQESLIASELWRAMRPRCELDIVVLNRASSILKYNVARFGIPLFTSSPRDWRAFRVRAFREFEDNARFRNRRWEQTLRRLRSESSLLLAP